MHTGRTLLAVLLCSTIAGAAEIFPIKGDPIKAEIVSVNDKDVVFKQADKQITKSVKEVMKIDFRESGKAPSIPHTNVELTDGTTLAVRAYTIKAKELEMTLLAGPKLKIPVSIVANILNDAHIEAYRLDWKSRIYNTRNKSAIVVRRTTETKRDIISSLECTIGDGDETGTAITVAVVLDGETITRQRKLASLHGLIFKNNLDPKATPMTCKLLDTQQDVVMVTSITSRADGYTVTTPAGAKIDFKKDQIARLDYSKGRLEYLSDLTPIKRAAKSNLDEGDSNPWFVFKDSNLNKGPMTLGGVRYAKGLALKPEVELTFDLKGEYREFEATVGIDDNVLALGGTVLTIEGDGKELTQVTVSSEDKKRFKQVVLNIKDVQKLRIHLRSDGPFDTSRHLDLADAKLRKE